MAVLLKRRVTIEKHKIAVEPCTEAKYCSPVVSQNAEVDDILLQPPDEESPKNFE